MVALASFAPCKDIPRTAATSSPIWPHRLLSPPLRTFSGRTASTSTTGQTSTWWRALWEADRAVASLTTSLRARCPHSGAMPAALGAGPIPWCSVTSRSAQSRGPGADGVLLADTVPPEAIFRILGADNKRGAYTEVLAEIGTDRMLHLVRDFRAEAVEAAAAAMDDSAAAAGSADVPGPVPLARARVPMRQTLRSLARTVICRTRRPLRPPRPRSVLELQTRLVRSALRPAMTSTWETSCPKLLLPTRASHWGTR